MAQVISVQHHPTPVPVQSMQIERGYGGGANNYNMGYPAVATV